MSYQPLWVDGKTVGLDIRQSAGRYEVIASCIKATLKPGFSVLDVGAHSGYFSVRLNQEFNAKVTAVDDAPQLLAGLKDMKGHTVNGVSKLLKPGDLLSFPSVDVALCLSVLHHVPWWEEMVGELLSMSRMLFVECAVPGENIAKSDDLLRSQNDLVKSLPGAMHVGSAVGFDTRHVRPMYLIPGQLA